MTLILKRNVSKKAERISFYNKISNEKKNEKQKNTTLSWQFQNRNEKSYQLVSDIHNIHTIAQHYMIAYFPGLVQAH